MDPSSRTPEGESNRCPVCGAEVRLEPSRPPGDAPCPQCGSLIWFEQENGPPLDRGMIEETKQTIREWISHILELSQSQVPPAEFFRELIDGVVRTLVARGGVLWLPGWRGMKIRYHVGLDVVGFSQSQLREPWHLGLIQAAMADGVPAARPPQRNCRIAREGANLTDSLVLLCPIKHGWKSRAVVEVFQRTGAGPATQSGYLRFLTQICDIAGKNRFFCSG